MLQLPFRGQEPWALNLSYPWVKLNLIISRGNGPITLVYCHSPLYTVFSLISSLNFHINYSRAVLHIPSNPIPCIAFVLSYIHFPFYIYPLLYHVKETYLMLIANGLVPAIEHDGSHLACVASVSVRFRRKERGTRVKDREKSGASKRAGRGGEERKETLADKPRDFENHPLGLTRLSSRTDI